MKARGSRPGTEAEERKCPIELVANFIWEYPAAVMSSNTLHSSVKPENYKAMVETTRAYGRYPLQICGEAA